MSKVRAKAKAAKASSFKMLNLSTKLKNNVLIKISEAIWGKREEICKVNQKDLSNAESLLRKGDYSKSLVKRLKLDESKLKLIVDMIKSVSLLDDPIGKTEYAIELDKGLELFRVTSPIGVIGVIFESRPDALPQIASLCLKSGNSVILKGGSEAKNSNHKLYSIINETSVEAGIPAGWIQLIDERTEVLELLNHDDLVDLIIPRGSNDFVKYIQKNTKIPVLGQSEGVCHVYVDEYADLEKAVEICYDAKVQYPVVCNAVDTIIVNHNIAENFLPIITNQFKEAGVEIRGCRVTKQILGDQIKEVNDIDWGKEYLELTVAIKIVNNLDEAISHINKYGSHHTDSIVTENVDTMLRFIKEVDSSSVISNASTRFSDGYRYGLGAEVGISTGKIHARGPTGLEGLTIYKYHLIGSGQTVTKYVGGKGKDFTHRKLSKNWNEKLKELSDEM